MTTCDDGSERVTLDLGDGADPFVGGESPLLGESDKPGPLTLRCDGDVHDGCVRALAAYLGSLSRLHKGREIRLQRVTVHQAHTGETEVPYPVAAVYGQLDAEGTYAGPPNSPQRASDALDSGDPFRPAWLYETATYMHDRIIVEVWCDDEVSRGALVKAIEDAAAPYRDVAGFKLAMAGYHNAVARYRLIGQSRQQDPTAATANVWLATFRFTVQAPTIRVHVSPRATVRTQVAVR